MLAAAAAGAVCGAAALAAQPMALGFVTPLSVVLPRGAEPPAPTQEEPPAAEPGEQPAPAGEPVSDPAVDRIIEDLERASRPRRAVEPIAPAGVTPARPGVVLPGVRPVPGGAAAGGAGRGKRVVPEGTFLPSRSGRMSRSAEGEWMFTFDGGPDGASEPPMVLMPCQLLEEMEAAAAQLGEGAVMTMSGQVFVYHGRNYVLPRYFRVERRTDGVMPTQ